MTFEKCWRQDDNDDRGELQLTSALGYLRIPRRSSGDGVLGLDAYRCWSWPGWLRANRLALEAAHKANVALGVQTWG
jgi:hypothetical protein